MRNRRIDEHRPAPAPAAILAAYIELVDQAAALDEVQRDVMRTGYLRAQSGRYRRVAAYAMALAYGTGRVLERGNGDDQVVGVDGPGRSVRRLLPASATDIGFAVLVVDLLDPRDFALLTGWWVNRYGPLPESLPTIVPEPIDPRDLDRRLRRRFIAAALAIVPAVMLSGELARAQQWSLLSLLAAGVVVLVAVMVAAHADRQRLRRRR